MMDTIPVTLDDGTATNIREISEADRERLAEGYRMLSPEARYHRFWTKVGELGDGMLDRLTKADQFDHVVWGATDPAHLHTPGMGAASYWRSKLDLEEAEFAATVVDPYQHCGLGTLLLGVLWQVGRANGLTRMVGYAMPENRKAIDWMRHIGASAEWDGYKVILRWNLCPPEELPNTPRGQILSKRLEEFAHLAPGR